MSSTFPASFLFFPFLSPPPGVACVLAGGLGVRLLFALRVCVLRVWGFCFVRFGAPLGCSVSPALWPPLPPVCEVTDQGVVFRVRCSIFTQEVSDKEVAFRVRCSIFPR